jgi:hypothetical protein
MLLTSWLPSITKNLQTQRSNRRNRRSVRQRNAAIDVRSVTPEAVEVLEDRAMLAADLRPLTTAEANFYGRSDAIVISKEAGTITDASPFIFTTDDTVYFDWLVKNAGDTVAGGFLVDLQLDVNGEVVTLTGGPISLAAGAVTGGGDWNFGQLPAGTHTIKLNVDPDNQIVEGAFENNNEFSRTFTVAAVSGKFPDLTNAGSISVLDSTGDSTIEKTEDVALDFTVENIGDAAAGPVKVEIFVDGRSKGTLTSGRPFLNATGLTPNGPHTEFSFEDVAIGKLVTGTHLIEIVIDPDGSVDEGSGGGENNNKFSTMVTVVGAAEDKPDLRPARIGGWDSPIAISAQQGTTTDDFPLFTTDSAVYVDLGIGNFGNATASPSFSVQLKLDDVLFTTLTRSIPVDGVSDGSPTGTLVFVNDFLDIDLGQLAAGEHKLELVVDSGGTIDEGTGGGEDNNSFVRTFHVLAPVTIRGVKWNDINGNGMRDEGEGLLQGFNVFLDSDQDGVRDPGETTVVTDVNGTYEFTGLPPATYHVAVDYSGAPNRTATSPEPDGSADGFDIDFDFSMVSLTAAQKQLFLDAAQTWESIITGDLPDLISPDGQFIDDLLIKVLVEPDDGVGGTLAIAGPILGAAWMHDVGGVTLLPAFGSLSIDSADIEHAGLALTILHEIGHVLGLGTLWAPRSVDDVPIGANFLTGSIGSGGTDPQYTAPLSVEQYNAIFNPPALATTIPVEGSLGPGSNDGHWRESVFDAELMSPESDINSKRSLVTLAALQDLGYKVDLNQAESYRPPGTNLPFVTVTSIVDTIGEEESGSAKFMLTRSGAPTGPLSVSFTVGGTADNGVDFSALTGTAIIQDGNSSVIIDVTPTSDAFVEGAETVEIAVAPGTGYTVGSPRYTTVIITDDELPDSFNPGSYVITLISGELRDNVNFGSRLNDPPPSLSINDVSVTEGNAGTVNAVFTVMLSAASGQTVTVDFATANGTALQPGDYTSTSGTLTFAPGETTKTITVLVKGDVLDEPNESYFINLTNPTNATISDNQGVGTINDDDATPSLSINDVSVTEGNAGTVNAVFTVMLSAASGQTVTVDFATANGTALQPGDYTSTSGTLTFAPGETTKTITVLVKGDVLDEPNESYFINLTNPTNATISDNQGVGTINDDDLAAETSVGLDPFGNLLIQDVNGGNTNDTLTISVNGSNIRVNDPSQTLIAGTGASQVDVYTIDVAIAGITGPAGIIVDVLGGDDVVNINGLPIGFDGNITINGQNGTDTVNFNGNANFASGRTLTVTSDIINVNSAIVTSGPGQVLLTADRNLQLSSGASITAVDGGITLEANKSGTATGDFVGIAINNANITTSGNGNILLDGTGGGSTSNRHGVVIDGGSIVSSTKTVAGGGGITILGIGGAGLDSDGIRIVGSFGQPTPRPVVRSAVGAIQLTGSSLADNGGNLGVSSNGVVIANYGAVESVGTGVLASTITIEGTSGIGGSSVGVSVGNSGVVTSIDGDIQIDGTGTNALRGIYMFNGGNVTSTGITGDAAMVTVIGTGGSDNAIAMDGSNGTRITSIAGGVDVTGTAGNSGINGVALYNSATIEVTTGSLQVTGAGGDAGAGIQSPGVRLSESSTGKFISHGSGVITVTSLAGEILSGGSSVIGGPSATGSITLTANGIRLNGGTVQSSAALTVRPNTPAATIGLGGGAGTLNLNDTAFATFVDGFSSITIGDITNGTGAVNIDTATFTDPVTIAGGTINDLGGTDITAPSVRFDGNVSPGQSPGELAVAGNATLASGHTFTVEIGGTSPGTANTNHDQLDATGSVTIEANVVLATASFNGFVPTAGQQFEIINRTGGSGTFNGLTEGAIVSADFLGSGLSATIGYAGGDGDDVVITVISVNNAPTATNLSAAETYTEDTPLNLTDIVISDVDSATVTATLTLSSPAAGSLNTGTSGAVTSTYNAGTGVWSASGVIASVNTLLAGLTFTPALNFNSNFTMATSVSDGVAPPITGTKVFTGIPVNDLPSISDIADRSIDEDTSTGAISFTIGDVETTAASLTVAVTSSNTAVVQNANIVFGGSGASRTVTVTPEPDKFGTAIITVTVTDGDGGSTSDTFLLTVNSVNDPPTISDIADRSILKDTSTGAISFTIGDVETTAASLTVTATSSNTAVVQNANIVFGGSGASRTVTVTPEPDKFGTAIITVTFTDGDGGSTSDTFLLTVKSQLIVTSFTRQSPSASLTNSDSLVFRATFSEATLNVDTEDFRVTASTGTVTQVALVTPGVYDLTVSGGNLAGFEGLIGIDLAPTQDITDLVSLALSATEPAIDETYLLDNTAPVVQSMTPADDAVSVSVGSDLVLIFSENIQAANGNIVIRRTSDNSVLETIPVPSSQVTIAGNTATINPTANLSYNTGYYVTVDAGALRDLAGNEHAGIAGTSTWNFTTEKFLTLTVSATSLSEAAGPAAATGRVTRTGSTVAALTVTITNPDPSELSLPTSVEIPAGASFADFTIATVNDGELDGDATGLSITASASGFSDSWLLNVLDDDTAGNRTLGGRLFEPISSGTYNVLHDIDVDLLRSLTIAPGTTLQFASNTGINVFGTLTADADPSSPIVFRSNQSSPVRGSWKGIMISNASAQFRSVLDSVRISHAATGLLITPTSSGSKVTLSSSEIHESSQSAVQVSAYRPDGPETISATDVLIQNNQLHHNTLYGVYLISNSGYPVLIPNPVASGTNSATVSGNEIRDNGGAGIRLNATSSTISNSATSTVNPTVSQNLIHRNGAGISATASPGAVLPYIPPTNPASIRGTYTNNVIVNNAGAGITLVRNTGPTEMAPVFINNTIAGNTGAGFLHSTTTSGFVFRNNIIAGNVGGISGPTGYAPVANTVENNLIFGNGGNPFVNYPAAYGSTNSVNANGTPSDAEANILVDPLFVGGGDYHLQPVSPAAGAGLTLGAPATDFDGRSRVGAVEIGAFELPNASPTLNAIPDPALIQSDAGLQTIGLTGISAGGGESQNLTVTIASSNPAIVTNPVFVWGVPQSTGHLTYTPVGNVSGTSIITVTVTDAGPDGIDGNADDQSFQRTFTVAVQSVPHEVNLTVSTSTGSEVGTTVVTVTATASGNVTGDQTVSLAVSGVGITGADYVLSNSQIVIPNGTSYGEVTFTVVDDAVVEAIETAILTISNPSAGLILGPNVTRNIQITSDDSATVSVTGESRNEGTGVSPTIFTFTVTLSAPVDAAVTMTANTRDGSAIAPGDYTAVSGTTVTFPANSTAPQTVEVAVTADNAIESDELLDLVISELMAEGLPVNFFGSQLTASVSATILDDDAPIAAYIRTIDDGDAGFTTLGGWTNVGNKPGVENGDFLYNNAGTGADQAAWQFNSVPDGQYRISASYREFSNRATNSPFQIFDGSTRLTTVPVNQQQPPDSFAIAGTAFEDLGTFNIVSGSIRVVLSDEANGLVVADAVRIERIGDVVPGAEIQVTVDGNIVTDNTEVVDFGNVEADRPITKIFTITNLGTTNLILSNPITVPAGFVLASGFGTISLAPFATTTFSIMSDTSSLGVHTGELSFGNNDAGNDENPFNFTVRSNVVPATGVQILDNGDTGFTTLGNWVSISGNLKGHENDFQYANSGSGSNSASWTFNVTPGQFRIAATWKDHSNRATAAPFTIYDDGVEILTATANQTLPPNGIDQNGTSYKPLGTFNISSNTLTVTLRDNTTGLVIADAIRIERIGDIPSGPEIGVIYQGSDVIDNIGLVDFGDVELGAVVTRTLTVFNFGSNVLNLIGTIVTTGGFSAGHFGATTLAPNSSTTFDLQINTSVLGGMNGTVAFGTNDADENPFNFAVQANVIPASTIQVIDNAGSGFTQTGSWVTVGRNGHNDTFDYALGSSTVESTSQWTFALADTGLYRVSATWRQHTNRATNARFTLNDDALTTVQVNQRLAPKLSNGIQQDGSIFQDLGVFRISGNTLTVTLDNLANGLVIADAIRIERVGD